jgi:hypothetical protein
MQIIVNLCESRRRLTPYQSSCSSFTLTLADATAWAAWDLIPCLVTNSIMTLLQLISRKLYEIDKSC